MATLALSIRRLTDGDAAEEGEGVFLAGKEVFETLFEGEFEVEHAAVAEDHDKGVEPAAVVADEEVAAGGEVDWGGFARLRSGSSVRLRQTPCQ